MFGIEISNMLRVENAKIEMLPGEIAVVSGENQTGKTSLAMLAAAVFNSSVNPFSIAASNKREYIRDGQDEGGVTLLYNGEPARRWNAKTGDMSVFVDVPKTNAEAVGLVGFTDGMSESERVKMWEAHFLPDGGELAEAFEEAMKTKVSRERLDNILEHVRNGNLDKVLKATQDHRAGAKAAWQLETGQTYGVAKAATWKPDGWRSELDDVTLVKARQAVTDAEEQLRSISVVKALTMNEIEKGKEAKDKIPEVEKKIEEIKAEGKEAKQIYQDATAKVEKARQNYHAIGLDVDKMEKMIKAHEADDPVKKPPMKCPSCGAFLILQGNVLAEVSEEAVNESRRLHKEKLNELTEKLKGFIEASGAQSKVVRNLDAIATERKGELDEITHNYTFAMTELEKLQNEAETADMEVVDADETGEQELQEATQALHDAQADMRMIEQHNKAVRAHESQVEYDTIIGIIGPKGVRSTKMAERMAFFDRILERVHQVSGWPRVKVAEKTYSIEVGGRRFLKLVGDSARAQAQYSLQTAMAWMNKSNVLILDKVDVLQGANRVGLKDLVLLVADKGNMAVMVCGTRILEDDNIFENDKIKRYSMKNGVLSAET